MSDGQTEPARQAEGRDRGRVVHERIDLPEPPLHPPQRPQRQADVIESGVGLGHGTEGQPVIGTTTVTCTARARNGAATTRTFTVNVIDDPNAIIPTANNGAVAVVVPA